VYLPSAFCVVKAEPEVSLFCDGFIWWWLSPQGRNPNTENSAWWKAGGSHYNIAISCLGSQIPKYRAPVGVRERTCHSTERQM
jgi:hypothetical protein